MPVTHPVTIPVCDTTNVSYMHDIQPALKTNCYSCHGDSVTTGGGLDLERFTTFKAYLSNGFRGDGIYGSKFYHCLLHSLGAQQMPPTYKLDSCTLLKVKAWIDIGAPEN
jgi:hypothetical protein